MTEDEEEDSLAKSLNEWRQLKDLKYNEVQEKTYNEFVRSRTSSYRVSSLDADGELVLLYRLLDPMAAAGFVKGLDELRFRRLVVDSHLFHLGISLLV